MFDPITIIAGWLGIDPASLLALIPIFVIIFNTIARLIPDDSTGFLGVVEKIAKVLGVYVSNRVSSGMSLNDIAKSAANVIPEIRFEAEQKDVKEIGETNFENQGRDKFVPPEFRNLLMIPFLAFSFLLFAGCATTSPAATALEISKTICYNREALQFVLNQVKPNPTAEKVQPLLDYLHLYCPMFFSQVDPELFERTLTIERANASLERSMQYAAR